jgi:hypothetical protein
MSSYLFFRFILFTQDSTNFFIRGYKFIYNIFIYKYMLCVVTDCGRNNKAKGYCDMHLMRLKRHGILEKIKKYNEICILNGCDEPQHSKGYCSRHYFRLWKYGDVNYTEAVHDHPDKCTMFFCDNPYKAKGLCDIHYSRKRVKEYPRSSRHGSLQEYVAMMNVRLRDKNHCKWYGCNKSIRNIHVHHIFPRSEYPELREIERYMICYCDQHHKKWHDARGDVIGFFVSEPSHTSPRNV